MDQARVETGDESARRDDEQKIRDLIAAWHRASADGDLRQLLPMMAEDVVFLVPGHTPMRGREAFASGFQTVIQNFRIHSTCEIQEIQTAGDWAYGWNHLSVTMLRYSRVHPSVVPATRFQ